MTWPDKDGPNLLCWSGGAFLTNAISLANDASFGTAFSFQITNPFNTGAGGIVFVVQTVANNVGGGGGIGYAGRANSVGVEFDTWDNGEDVFIPLPAMTTIGLFLFAGMVLLVTGARFRGIV